jgi:hypothetical protein
MIKINMKLVPILLIVMAGCTQRQSNTTGMTPDLEATIVAGVAATSHASYIEPTKPAPTQTIIQVTQTLLVAPQPTQAYATKNAMDTGLLVVQDIDQLAITINGFNKQLSEAEVDEDLTKEESQGLILNINQATGLISTISTNLLAFQEMYGWIVPQSAIKLATLQELITMLKQSLQEVNLDLEQGKELHLGTKGRFDDPYKGISTNAGLLQAQAQSWLVDLEKELSYSLITIKSIQPDNVPVDKIAVFQRASEYIDLVNQTLSSDSLTQEKVLMIIHLGANLAAGLKAHGGVSLQNLALSIDLISASIAQGEFGQAKQALDGFEKGLGNRPSIPTATIEAKPGSSIQFVPEP